MKLAQTAYELINAEPTFTHKVDAITKTVADDFRQFTASGALHVCMRSTEHQLRLASRKFRTGKPKVRANGDLSSFYSTGGIAHARKLMTAFFASGLGNIVFWMKTRPNDDHSITYYQMREGVDERNERAFYLNVVEYEYNPVLGTFNPTPYRMSISENKMLIAKRFLTNSTSSGISAYTEFKIMHFADWSNTDERINLLTTARTLLERHSKARKKCSFKAPRICDPEALIVQEDGRRYHPLPFSTKRIDSLQDLVDVPEEIARPANENWAPQEPRQAAGNHRPREAGNTAFHPVRGHWRHYRSGKVVWIPAHTRGNINKQVFYKLSA